jgi:uncharacterized protein (TIGR03435 family)
VRKSRDAFGWRAKLFFGAAGFAAVALLVIFGAANATSHVSPHASRAQQQSQSQTQSQTQSGAPAAPSITYEYEVASIKRFIPVSGMNMAGRAGFSETPDGLDARIIAVSFIIQRAYGVEGYQISGAPDWVNSERYIIEAKMDGSVIDALQKLSPDDRTLARRQMLQKLLAERFNLAIHRENKELQVYNLVVAKNGPKLQEAKPDTPDADASKAGIRYGTIMFWGGHLRARGAPLLSLAQILTLSLHRPVLDKTALPGKYDITMNWTPDENPSQAPSGPQGSSGGAPIGQLPSDPSGGPSLFTAIQEQLGLKLESGKAPVEMIAIDHVERPSGN